MKIKTLLFALCFLASNFIFAQLSLTNTLSTFSIVANNSTGLRSWCYVLGGGPSAPPTGDYIVRVEWTDLNTTMAAEYQSPGSPGPYDLLTLTSGPQTLTLTSLNNAVFPTMNADGFDFTSSGDVSVTIKKPDLSRTWILNFQNGALVPLPDPVPSCGVVPITLVSFTAYKQGNTAVLNWVTTNEYDMNRHEIQRSTDGNSFPMIGYLPADNSSSTQHNYQFVDNYPNAARTYYRLKSIDNYGQVTYSPIRTLNGFTPVGQPSSGPCNYAINTLNSTDYSLNYYLSNTVVNWSATAFYQAANAVSLSPANVPNAIRLTVPNANFITLTANINGCTSGGNLVKYIISGVPQVQENVVSQSVTQPCTGQIVYNSKTITITPFPSTIAADYKWYLNNVFIGTGLTNTLINSSTQTSSYQIRYDGLTGSAITNGIINAVPTYPPCTPPNIFTTITSRVITDYCTGVITSSTKTVTINPIACTSGSDYQWIVNGSNTGTGLSRTFNVLSGTTYNYEIRYNGPCGLSIVSGTIWGSGAIPIDFAKIAPNPIKSNLRMDSRRPSCDPIPTPSEPMIAVVKINMITGYEIFDYSGNRVTFQELKTPIDILDVNVQNLKRGNYRLIIHYGDLKEDKQIKLVD